MLRPTFTPRAETMQVTFSPSDYTFAWTGEGRDMWYTLDEAKGRALALAARKARKKELEAEGWTVRLSSLGTQLRSKGGIGSGCPHIEFYEPCYMLDARKAAERW